LFSDLYELEPIICMCSPTLPAYSLQKRNSISWALYGLVNQAIEYLRGKSLDYAAVLPSFYEEIRHQLGNNSCKKLLQVCGKNNKKKEKNKKVVDDTYVQQ
jgi:hypothetical protein